MSVCEKKYLLLHLEATHFRTTLQQQTWQWEKEIREEIPLDFRQDVIKFLSFHISLLWPVGRILTNIGKAFSEGDILVDFPLRP